MLTNHRTIATLKLAGTPVRTKPHVVQDRFNQRPANEVALLRVSRAGLGAFREKRRDILSDAAAIGTSKDPRLMRGGSTSSVVRLPQPCC